MIIDGTKRISDLCRTPDITIIDTSGLIDGEAGKALKAGKIRALEPEHIIALQRGDELEHILEDITDINIYRVTVSHLAKVRSRGDRIRYRKEKYEDYFKKEEVSEFLFYINSGKCFYSGKSFHPREGDFEPGTLIGLNNNEDTFALGIMNEISNDSIVFSSPIKSLEKVNRVVFSDITT